MSHLPEGVRKQKPVIGDVFKTRIACLLCLTRISEDSFYYKLVVVGAG